MIKEIKDFYDMTDTVNLLLLFLSGNVLYLLALVLFIIWSLLLIPLKLIVSDSSINLLDLDTMREESKIIEVWIQVAKYSWYAINKISLIPYTFLKPVFLSVYHVLLIIFILQRSSSFENNPIQIKHLQSLKSTED